MKRTLNLGRLHLNTLGLAALAGLGLALASSPARAADADRAIIGAAASSQPAGQNWVAEYYFEVPGYMLGMNYDTGAPDSPPARYLQLAQTWIKEQPLGAEGAPQCWAWLARPPEGSGRWNHLVQTVALHVLLWPGSPAQLDELDARLAKPGAGLAALPAATRWTYEDFDRRQNPEAYSPRDLIVDGTKIRYPDEASPVLIDQVRMTLGMLKDFPSVAAFGLPSASPDEPLHFGPLARFELKDSGEIDIRTIPTPWDYVPPGTAPDTRMCTYYHSKDDDDSVRADMKDSLSRPGHANGRIPVVLQGIDLVYPLLPPERWETGHPEDYYKMNESIAEQTGPLYDQYAAVAQKWLDAHPSFTDEDQTHELARLGYDSNDWHEITGPVEGRDVGNNWRLVSHMVFMLQVYSEDPAVVDELRALLDAVPGVHPRAERVFSMDDYGNGKINFSD